MSAIRIEDLRVAVGELRVLDGLTLSIERACRTWRICEPFNPGQCLLPALSLSTKCTMRSGSLYGYGFIRTPYTTLKTAVVAPMPRDSESMAVRAKPGLFRNCR